MDSWSGFWGRFQWKENVDNTVSLWPVSGGEPVDPWSLPPDLRATTSYTVTVRDENYKVISKHTFTEKAPVNGIADYLTKQKLRLGLDSIQITHLARNSYYVRVGGIAENFNKIDFHEPTKWQLDNYAFSPRKSGLRAFYIHQNRIDDHLYRIKNQNRSLTTSPGNVFVDFFTDRGYPDWQVTYDKDKLAYRIKMSASGYGNRNLAWTPKDGHNVFVYTQLPSATQYWMFKKSESTDQYEIISAIDTTKYLNVDADEKNVSVAKQTYEYHQLFQLEKIDK